MYISLEIISGIRNVIELKKYEKKFAVDLELELGRLDRPIRFTVLGILTSFDHNSHH